jgi:hypothetical protein
MKFGTHPANLVLRFILEVAVLFSSAFWGWTQHEGIYRFLFAIGLPVVLTSVWGIFAVPGDPSRSGKTVVSTPGWIRLIIELGFFGFGAYFIYDAGYHKTVWIFLILVVFHYIISFDRVNWLLKQ